MALGDTTFTKPTENKMKTIENITHNTYWAATFDADLYNSMWAVGGGRQRDRDITDTNFLVGSQETWGHYIMKTN